MAAVIEGPETLERTHVSRMSPVQTRGTTDRPNGGEEFRSWHSQSLWSLPIVALHASLTILFLATPRACRYIWTCSISITHILHYFESHRRPYHVSNKVSKSCLFTSPHCLRALRKIAAPTRLMNISWHSCYFDRLRCLLSFHRMTSAYHSRLRREPVVAGWPGDLAA